MVYLTAQACPCWRLSMRPMLYGIAEGKKAVQSGPLAFTELSCRFAPETRNLTAGKATRYIGGKAALTLSGGASEIVCLLRRMAWGVRWPKRAWDRHHFDKGIIRVNQTPADYLSGANYELTANGIDDLVDF